ncbi:hypothetical protein CMUS01_05215 [Colletotrichum musicola]|uniref:Uncharacterized protein n=1 Tax=Colletotrichum musicola TaxID=2175873 RepID=A0A8H6KSM1_9PEZI|nr:hypothetical protein CMUS01_05215 [Colletotrichum musicola]
MRIGAARSSNLLCHFPCCVTSSSRRTFLLGPRQSESERRRIDTAAMEKNHGMPPFSQDEPHRVAVTARGIQMPDPAASIYIEEDETTGLRHLLVLSPMGSKVPNIASSFIIRVLAAMINEGARLHIRELIDFFAAIFQAGSAVEERQVPGPGSLHATWLDFREPSREWLANVSPGLLGPTSPRHGDQDGNDRRRSKPRRPVTEHGDLVVVPFLMVCQVGGELLVGPHGIGIPELTGGSTVSGLVTIPASKVKCRVKRASIRKHGRCWASYTSFSAPSDAMPRDGDEMWWTSFPAGREKEASTRRVSGVAAIINNQMARLPRSDEREEKNAVEMAPTVR